MGDLLCRGVLDSQGCLLHLAVAPPGRDIALLTSGTLAPSEGLTCWVLDEQLLDE